MKQHIVNLLKTNHKLRQLFGNIAGAFLRLLKLLVKENKNQILFVSFGGRKFDDSPRAIYELMCKDGRFEHVDMVWAFHEPDKFELPHGKKIKTDTLRYFVTALSAKVWVSNSSVHRGIPFVGKNTFYLNTWHGSPIKFMGKDLSEEVFDVSLYSCISKFCVQSDYDAHIFERAFAIPPNKMLYSGLPRNDELAFNHHEIREKIRTKLQITPEQKVILYAPTYREYLRDEKKNCILKPPIDLNKWEKTLGKQYVFLFRAHYEISRALGIEGGNDFVKDVSAYPNLNELMIAADLLISDYSSIFFDYAITGKPMIHFCYDYEQYAEQRGLYFDVRDWLDGADNEDELLMVIQKQDFDSQNESAEKFRKKYVQYYGKAAEKCLDEIAKIINT